ncbi:MAG: hypothetical protein MUC97_08620 [Bernardetiaceae bacterium]|jgi:hypothetical protein|nr:hypothetical protein [Bernardetiaceae bacterium]
MEEQNSRSAFMDFIQSVQDSIKKMTTLEIKTIVGDFALGTNEEVTTLGGDYKVMQSQFNLLLGDVTVKIDKELLESQFDWVRDFHAMKEKEGHAIVQSNINLLLMLISLYRQTFKEQQAAGVVVNNPNNVYVNPGVGGGILPPVINQPVIGGTVPAPSVVTVGDGSAVITTPGVGGIGSIPPSVVADYPSVIMDPPPLTNPVVVDTNPIVSNPVVVDNPVVVNPNPPPATDVFGNPIGTSPVQ